MVDYVIQNYNNEKMARAMGVSLPISTKVAIELCNFLRKKNISTAKKQLDEIINKKRALPFTRFNKGVGHKKKIGPGRYPEKASKEILSLLEQVEANAQFKGLNTSNLMITHICANRASRPYHYGRTRGIRAKRTHVEVVVIEKSKEEKKQKNKGKK